LHGGRQNYCKDFHSRELIYVKPQGKPPTRHAVEFLKKLQVRMVFEPRNLQWNPQHQHVCDKSHVLSSDCKLKSCCKPEKKVTIVTALKKPLLELYYKPTGQKIEKVDALPFLGSKEREMYLRWGNHEPENIIKKKLTQLEQLSHGHQLKHLFENGLLKLTGKYDPWIDKGKAPDTPEGKLLERLKKSQQRKDRIAKARKAQSFRILEHSNCSDSSDDFLQTSPKEAYPVKSSFNEKSSAFKNANTFMSQPSVYIISPQTLESRKEHMRRNDFRDYNNQMADTSLVNTVSQLLPVVNFNATSDQFDLQDWNSQSMNQTQEEPELPQADAFLFNDVLEVGLHGQQDHDKIDKYLEQTVESTHVDSVESILDTFDKFIQEIQSGPCKEESEQQPSPFEFLDFFDLNQSDRRKGIPSSPFGRTLYG
jgi:hypothetical protein